MKLLWNYSLQREKIEIQYQLTRLMVLAENQSKVETNHNVIWKILNFIPNNHSRAEYHYLLSQQKYLEDRLYDIKQQLKK